MNRATLLQNAADLLPSLRERAADVEVARNVPDSTIKDLIEADLFRVMQPKLWGGYELDPGVFLELGMLLSTACGSTGWVYSILCVHSWELGCMTRTAQEEVWGDDTNVLVSSSYAPTGEVEPTAGGYRIRGRWQFSSGCEHAKWALLGARVEDSDGPRTCAFLVPRSDYVIEDTWRVIGLRGTGSHDVVIEDAFVPDHRVHALTSGSDVSDSRIYRVPFPALFGYSLTAPVIGMAQGALDAHIDWTKNRTRKATASKVAGEVFSQIRVAEAARDIDAARVQMLATFDDMLQTVDRGEEIPYEARVRARRDQVLGTRAAVAAIDQVFTNSGAHAIHETSVIQRFWRDAHAASLHNSNVAEPILSAYGALRFGDEQPGPF
ncbi:MAG: flavin-dependent monooxygenase [Actinobacteria bacterium]|nr:flavin-dependent monooxygenase [Actinomycetota bacterium]